MKVFKGGKVLTMAGATYEPGYVAVEDGKITAVGRVEDLGEEQEGAEVIDLTGKWILPGMIDAHTHVGIGELAIGREGQDTNEATESVTPHMRAIDGTDPEDGGFRDAISAGITAINIMPGSANVIGGLAFATKTHGTRLDQMVLRHPTGMKAAMGENPKMTHGDKRMPSTRMGIAALFRDMLIRTQNYIAKQDAAEPGKPVDRDIKLEQMALVMRHQIPMRIHAHRADDILTALRIRDEFGFDMVLDHATEGFKIADELVQRGIPAAVGPMLTARYKPELRQRSLRTPGIMVKAGVKVALITDHSVVPIHLLLVGLVLAVRDGLDPDRALELVTINPAEILGISDRVGSLEPGKDADLAIFNGDPLNLLNRVVKTYVNGELVYEYQS